MIYLFRLSFLLCCLNFSRPNYIYFINLKLQYLIKKIYNINLNIYYSK